MVPAWQLVDTSLNDDAAALAAYLRDSGVRHTDG